MTKNEFIDRRTKIISALLDAPTSIKPTTKCFAALDDLFDELSPHLSDSARDASWAQIERDTAAEHNNVSVPDSDRDQS